MPEIEDVSEDDLIDYIMVSIEINLEKCIGSQPRVHRDTTLGFAIGRHIERWCNENKITTFAGRFYRKGKNYQIDIWFENEADAMAFRLRWG